MNTIYACIPFSIPRMQHTSFKITRLGIPNARAIIHKKYQKQTSQLTRSHRVAHDFSLFHTFSRPTHFHTERSLHCNVSALEGRLAWRSSKISANRVVPREHFCTPMTGQPLLAEVSTWLTPLPIRNVRVYVQLR